MKSPIGDFRLKSPIGSHMQFPKENPTTARGARAKRVFCVWRALVVDFHCWCIFQCGVKKHAWRDRSGPRRNVAVTRDATVRLGPSEATQRKTVKKCRKREGGAFHARCGFRFFFVLRRRCGTRRRRREGRGRITNVPDITTVCIFSQMDQEFLFGTTGETI